MRKSLLCSRRSSPSRWLGRSAPKTARKSAPKNPRRIRRRPCNTTSSCRGPTTAFSWTNRAAAAGRCFAVRTCSPRSSTWLAVEFDLPAIHSHPQIDAGAGRDDRRPAATAACSRSANKFGYPTIGARRRRTRDTVAVYSRRRAHDHLPEGWTGSTQAELSVLVHEMVHHAQNLIGLKHECPQEREKLADHAQDRGAACSAAVSSATSSSIR